MTTSTTLQDTIAPVAGEQLRRRGITGRGVGIAVIDSGVTAPEAFGDRLIVGPDFTADGGTDRHGQDHTGHGTHLAAIAAGIDTGVAPGSHVLSLKVVAEDGSTDVGAVIAAIDFAIAHRRQLSLGVLLLAFGADQLPSGHDPLAAAIARARRAGLVPVVSAGNGGDAALPTPAHVAEALTVGAAELVDEQWQVCDFTTTGRGAQRADLVAPGRSIVSALAAGSAAAQAPAESFVGDRHVKGTGSSQAAAVVAGAAALLLEADGSITADDVVSILRTSAHRIADPAAGAGALDLEVALACLASGLFGAESPEQAKQTAVAGAWSGLEWSASLDGSGVVVASRWTGFAWTGLEWVGLRAVWSGFAWTGLAWSGFSLDRVRVDGSGVVGLLAGPGSEWTGLEWSGWSGRVRVDGLEWSGSLVGPGVVWSGVASSWTGFGCVGRAWSGPASRWTGLEWRGFSLDAEALPASVRYGLHAITWRSYVLLTAALSGERNGRCEISETGEPGASALAVVLPLGVAVAAFAGLVLEAPAGQPFQFPGRCWSSRSSWPRRSTSTWRSGKRRRLSRSPKRRSPSV